MIQGVQVVGVNYDNFKDAQVLDGTGALRVNLGRPNVGTIWLIDRIWFRSDGGNNTTLRVYATANPLRIQPNDVIDFSPSIDENLSDEVQPPIVRDRESLVLDFTAGTAGDLMHFRIDYRIGYLQAFQAPPAVVYPAAPGVIVSPQEMKKEIAQARVIAANQWPGSPS